MKNNWTIQLIALLGMVVLVSNLAACSKSQPATTSTRDMIIVDNGADAPTLDPSLTEETASSRIIYDLFEGLTSVNQKMKVIPGLADNWEISKDQLTYTFHLRPGIKFSDGTPITANDVVFTWRRLADPKTGSAYNTLASNIVNGKAIIENKLPVTSLGVTAIDNNTVQIKLVNPDAAFLAICSMPNVGIVSEANLKKYGTKWTLPANMVTSGAYQLNERVIQGYILISKNPYYYAANKVAIPKVKFLPIVDLSSSLSQYQTGNIDVTFSIPVDQYKRVLHQLPKEAYTVSQDAIYYYALNMQLPEFRNNPKLRQALSMAVDRQALVTAVLGQGQVPSYSYVTTTIEEGKFADVEYEWANWSREKQIATAKKLFSEAGYNENHPLQISISYNTMDLHKKIALAVGSMWQEVFGEKSIQVTSANQEWKTFIQARDKGDFQIARDGFIADYDSVDTYTVLYQCNNPLNHSHACNKQYDNLLEQAKTTSNPEERVRIIHQALKTTMNDYIAIPLYQYTYYRLVKPYVEGYDIEDNHLDHVMSKWYYFDFNKGH